MIHASIQYIYILKKIKCTFTEAMMHLNKDFVFNILRFIMRRWHFYKFNVTGLQFIEYIMRTNDSAWREVIFPTKNFSKPKVLIQKNSFES